MQSMPFVLAAAFGAAPLLAQIQPKPNLPPSVAAKPAAYDYTATIASAAKVQGNVVAAGITWNCQGTRCTTSGPWPTPGVGACAALSKIVGTVTAYGHPAKQLTAVDLQTCNQGGSATGANIAVTTPMTAQKLGTAKPVTPPPPGSSGAAPPPASGAPPPPPSSETPRTGPVSLRTSAFQVSGTGALAAALPFTPKNVRTAAFQVNGTGSTAFGTTFTPKVVRTAPMTVTGTGSN
jgi:hypothetical protein